MKKILTITILLILTVGLFVSCNADVAEKLLKPKKDSTVSAIYTVTFDMQDHGEPIEQMRNVPSGAKITAPETPETIGYIFDGWYKEDTCTNAWNFDTDKVTADITLYAKWTQTFTVTFDMNDYGEQINPITNVQCGTTIDSPKDPTEENYTFLGWYKEEECETKWDFDKDTVTNDITLYANWIKTEDIDDYTMKEGSKWFKSFSSTPIGTDTTKVTNIIFCKKLPQGVEEVNGKDLTANSTEKVKGHLVSNGDSTYTIYIVGDYIFGNKNCNQMFINFQKLENLALDNFDTSRVEDMSYMFAICKKLIDIDFSSFNTSNVNNMSCMFYSCSSLESINFSNFNTSTVGNMSNMFNGCSSLTSLDLSNFDTSSVNNMEGMFSKCSILSELNLSSFDTSNVTNMKNMFSDCKELKSVTFGEKFDISKVETMEKMFINCSTLSSLTLKASIINKNQTETDMSGMFEDCSVLASLDLSNFDTSNATKMANIFEGCSSLESVTFGDDFSTSSVKTMNSMFKDCSKLESLYLSTFDTSNVTDMSLMFEGCTNLRSIDFGEKYDTAKVTSMVSMFADCSSIMSLDLSHFKTSKVTNMGFMFLNCATLSSLDLTSFNTLEVTDMQQMFSNCSDLTELDISSFDLSSTPNRADMFMDIPKGSITIYVSNPVDWASFIGYNFQTK